MDAGSCTAGGLLSFEVSDEVRDYLKNRYRSHVKSMRSGEANLHKLFYSKPLVVEQQLAESLNTEEVGKLPDLALETVQLAPLTSTHLFDNSQAERTPDEFQADDTPSYVPLMGTSNLILDSDLRQESSDLPAENKADVSSEVDFDALAKIVADQKPYFAQLSTEFDQGDLNNKMSELASYVNPTSEEIAMIEKINKINEDSKSFIETIERSLNTTKVNQNQCSRERQLFFECFNQKKSISSCRDLFKHYLQCAVKL